MTTEAEDALADLFEGRAEAGLAGFRQHSVAVVYEWADDESGAGGAGFEETPLTEAHGQPPKIVWESDDDSSTDAPSNTILIGPVTPMPGVLELLTRPLEAGEARFLKVSGPRCPDTERFQILNVEVKPLRLMIRAQGFSNAYSGYS